MKRLMVFDLIPNFDFIGSTILVLKLRESSLYHIKFVVIPKGAVSNALQKDFDERHPVWVKFDPNTLEIFYNNEKVKVHKYTDFDLDLSSFLG